MFPAEFDHIDPAGQARDSRITIPLENPRPDSCKPQRLVSSKRTVAFDAQSMDSRLGPSRQNAAAL